MYHNFVFLIPALTGHLICQKGVELPLKPKNHSIVILPLQKNPVTEGCVVIKVGDAAVYSDNWDIFTRWHVSLTQLLWMGMLPCPDMRLLFFQLMDIWWLDEDVSVNWAFFLFLMKLSHMTDSFMLGLRKNCTVHVLQTRFQTAMSVNTTSALIKCHNHN